jgi:hypothetical protein
MLQDILIYILLHKKSKVSKVSNLNEPPVPVPVPALAPVPVPVPVPETFGSLYLLYFQNLC